MIKAVKFGEISPEVQQAIVGAALKAALLAFEHSGESEMALDHARTTAEAGVRAWQIANGVTA